MAAKFFVWGEGVWRELDVASGRVSSWRRRARFVFVRRGRLQVARRRPVLQALHALAARQPSAAADGPRLAHHRKSAASHRTRGRSPPPPPPLLPAACDRHHCCAHVNGYYDSDKVPQHLPGAPATPVTPASAARLREAGTQCGTERAITINVTRKRKPAERAPDPGSADEFVHKPARSRASEASARCAKPVKTHASSLEHSSDDGRERQKRRKRARAPVIPRESSSGEECRELIIPEDNVVAMRGYVARTQPSALARFDADESYRLALFYTMNPLVVVTPCARLERMLAERGAVTLPQFAARLGLAPSPSAPRPRPGPRPGAVRLRERSAEADADKENKDKHASPNKEAKSGARGAASEPALRPRAADTLGVAERSNKPDKEVVVIKAPRANGILSNPVTAKRRAPKEKKTVVASGSAGGPGPATAPPAGTHVISKRAYASGAKEYSNLEDHAIVAWVSIGSRASLVNGNRVWRDLQEQYERLTGCARSWHSLRNRYLRYILPALGALRLPPADVSRLRAAAATGAIRTKQRAAAGLVPGEGRGEGRRNSLFEPAERGAASRRARAPSSSAESAASAADDDFSIGAASELREARASRRLRAQHAASKDTSAKDESSRESGGRRAGGAGGGWRAGGAGGARSPRYSEVTRRFAARRVLSPSPSPSPAPEPAATRSRKLFNPN